ncbi:cytochrome P450 6k1-like [Odontomachus brunneus]|uniref:cytochrome P450 6k1-like n=1 Tax=Odontomachus brunneus TaxID=486640 RepID=UPI0013F1EC6A|nr:cytochrome P450 6k1-like [Odontomachus brunneus]XP_032670009.1 cytochrome P450 6k1-like [Odontomachus brunneus]XP_032670010.1 cytochrome P450 6k1-like [Odontomachus brunneus]XP_032670011.1 cytochrome P450 6k1-like [Odontomachus brunneus]
METVESTSCSLIYCTTALAIFIGLFYAYAKYKLSYWSRRGVKTPPTHLIFGNFKDSLLFKKSPAEMMREIYDSADPDDPYIGFYIFHKPMLLLRDHDLIKQMMARHFDIFPNRRFGSSTGTDIMGLRNLLAIRSQPIWKYLRAKLTPALTGQRLKAMMPLIMQCTEPLLTYVDGLPTDKNGWMEPQDMLEISSRYINNVLASVIYGIDVNSFDVNDSGFFEAALKMFRGFKRAMVTIIYFFIPTLIPLIKPFSTWPINYFRKCFKASMKYREQTGNKRGDFVDFLIMLKNGEQNPLFKFERENLLAQAAAFHIAGFESTGTSTAWAIYELAHHPEYQNTLYEEIKKYLSGKEITMELINEMPFLDCVVNEALRLHPPIPVVDRIAEKDFEVPETGLVIEKGVSIYVSVNAMYQDSRYFNDSCNFVPLRETENKKFYESLTFGIGPRSCIGQRLASLLAKITLINFVLNYEISLSHKNEESKNETSKISVHVFKYAVDGLNVRFKKRE